MQFSNAYLSTEIEYLKGVGPARGKLLREEIGVQNFQDLLNYFPFRYVDKSVISSIRDIHKGTDYIQLVGSITKMEQKNYSGRNRLSATLQDATGSIHLVWFQGAAWIKDKLRREKTYKVYGKVSFYKGRRTIAHPDFEPFNPNQKLKVSFEPIYSTTEKLRKKGLDSYGLQKLMRQLFSGMKASFLPEFFSEDVLHNYQLISRSQLYRNIHFPKSKAMLAKARYRVKFEDLFIHQLNILKIKLDRYNATPGPTFANVGDLFNNFYNNELSFAFTEAQKRVIKEIRRDTAKGKHMNRLLQGDVGSGKTIVALMAILLAVDNGFQATLMAPTEILALQHFESLTSQLSNLKIKVALLTGSIKGKKREDILIALRTGNIDLLIGTHALIEDPVAFQNLGIAIIDEQHRFGVAQRAKLWNKRKGNMAPHILVMTATPIPRTLAMTNFGDLDVSVIDELPPGRKPVKTLHKTEKHRDRLVGFMKEEIAKGRQIYVVYPLIEESEKLDLKDLFNGFNDLQNYFPYPDYKTSVVHGKMKASEKEAEMKRFVDGITQIMVATTVIEVGVNVPNASVMIIENAARFGLAQLHQLRGRVGRGAEQSYCILMTKTELSDYAKKRIDTMVSTNNGFEIAEADLKLRGPGEIEGTRQSGEVSFRLANLAEDRKIAELARACALHILQYDDDLSTEKNRPLKSYLAQSAHQATIWSKIS